MSGAMVLAYYWLPFGSASTAALAALAVGAPALALTLLWRRHGWLTLAAAVVCLSAAVGFAWRWGYDAFFVEPALPLDGAQETVVVEALSYPEETAYGSRLTARVLRPAGRRWKALLYLDDVPADMKPGDRFVMEAQIRAPAPGSVEDRLASARPRGVMLSITQRGAYTQQRPEAVPWLLWPVVWARALGDGLKQALPPEAAALARALFTGDKSGLGEDVMAAFSDTGLSHVVAVSGLHISFLMGFMLLLVGHKRRYAFFVAVPVIVLFVAVAGFPASAMRAAIMQGFFLFFWRKGEERDSLSALSLSLAVLLMANPYAVADVGLQLSYTSVLGIILFARRWQQSWEESVRWLSGFWKAIFHYIFTSVAVSLAALVFTLPLMMVYFGTFSLIAPLANLLLLWVVTLCFLVGVLTALIAQVWMPLAVGLGYVAAPFFDFFLMMVRLLARVPFAALKEASPYMVLWAMFAYTLFWLYTFWPKEGGRARRALAPTLGAAFMLLLALVFSAIPLDPLQIEALDVGQGQSILLLTPDVTMVVDCGGSVSHVARRVSDRLKSMGRRRIDLLALTHTHADHAGAAVDLMRQMDVACVALPAIEGEGSNLRGEVLRAASELGVAVAEIGQTTRYALGQGSLLVYPPLVGGGENELGLTFLACLGEFEFLITGDLNTTSERALLRTVSLPSVEVLVAGHHGSKYATCDELLTETAPQAAIISVGRNYYGHPTPETLGRLAVHGVEVYRTDEWGSVRVCVGPPDG
ncbi:MAG: DNA internalization-related competence protein ComEC/Rec2 [Oscillospiraceae bacterium]|nr:DNA internalization-related competence protein ComEC/Rec2 [Oscillospiraceae bacterium]